MEVVMSDIGRFDREARTAMKKFYVQIQKHAEWAIEIINTADRYSGALQQEMLRGTANTLEIWRRDFEELAKKQGKVETKFNGEFWIR
jgi:NADH:ubiquinone oxidoreductase subunit E